MEDLTQYHLQNADIFIERDANGHTRDKQKGYYSVSTNGNTFRKPPVPIKKTQRTQPKVFHPHQNASEENSKKTTSIFGAFSHVDDYSKIDISNLCDDSIEMSMDTMEQFNLPKAVQFNSFEQFYPPSVSKQIHESIDFTTSCLAFKGKTSPNTARNKENKENNNRDAGACLIVDMKQFNSKKDFQKNGKKNEISKDAQNPNIQNMNMSFKQESKAALLQDDSIDQNHEQSLKFQSQVKEKENIFFKNVDSFQTNLPVSSSNTQKDPSQSIALLTPSSIKESNLEQDNKKNSNYQEIEEIYQDGSRFRGYKLDGNKHGKGVLLLSNGSRYEGDWKNDVMSGLGKLYYSSGSLAYEGGFKDNKVHGKGIMHNERMNDLENNFEAKINFENFSKVGENWISFEGIFQNDMKNGIGKWHFSNGDVFIGEFKSDKVEGKGMYISDFGRKKNIGIWKKNLLVCQLN